MVALIERGDVSYRLVRADAKKPLRVDSKPNADRSGEWPMRIIKHPYLMEVAEC